MSERRLRILAIDFGDRRTGLAATDGSGTIVLPLTALHGLDDQACAAAIRAVAIDRQSDVVVVGLPLNNRGKVGPRAQRTLQFVEILRKAVACEVATIDETYSTDEAHERLKQGGLTAARRRALADSVAAMVICERYRDLRQPRRPRPLDPDEPDGVTPPDDVVVD